MIDTHEPYRIAFGRASVTVRRLLITLVCLAVASGAATGQEPRPTVGVAFGGGSARGIAHVGVIRWFEEHRIPLDVASGTSMGGIVSPSALNNGEQVDLMLGRIAAPYYDIRTFDDLPTPFRSRAARNPMARRF